MFGKGQDSNGATPEYRTGPLRSEHSDLPRKFTSMVQPGNNGIPADLNISPSQVYPLMLLQSHELHTAEPVVACCGSSHGAVAEW